MGKSRKPKSPPGSSAIGALIDDIRKQFKLQTDAAVAQALQVPREVISYVRHGRRPVPDSFVLRVHEVFDIPVTTIRQHMAAIVT